MNKYERLYRVISEAFVVSVSFLLLARPLNYLTAVLIAFLTVHTLFWFFNGHFYVLMRYVSNQQNNPAKFISYITKIYERINKKRFLLAAVAFGSLSKGRFSSSSDFDLRLIRRKGFINSILAFNYCALERARALLNAFPLDIYVFDMDEIKYKNKIRADEPPIIFYDSEGVLSMGFAERKRISFVEFSQEFEKRYIQNDGKN
jgi:predicted nucleotidyltransferase